MSQPLVRFRRGASGMGSRSSGPLPAMCVDMSGLYEPRRRLRRSIRPEALGPLSRDVAVDHSEPAQNAQTARLAMAHRPTDDSTPTATVSHNYHLTTLNVARSRSSNSETAPRVATTAFDACEGDPSSADSEAGAGSWCFDSGLFGRCRSGLAGRVVVGNPGQLLTPRPGAIKLSVNQWSGRARHVEVLRLTGRRESLTV